MFFFLGSTGEACTLIFHTAQDATLFFVLIYSLLGLFRWLAQREEKRGLVF